MRFKMTVTHKILVNAETGKLIQPAYEIDHPRPCPPDAVWIEILPDTVLYKHYCIDPPEDISHVDLAELYWDFEGKYWVEVETTSLPSFEKTKFNRNELLKDSDRIFVNLTDSAEIEGWKKYRQELRDMFVGKSDDYDWNMVVFPRTPVDIAELKRKAAEGDTEAAEIIVRDNL